MEALLLYIRRTLPDDLEQNLAGPLSDLENGNLAELLSSPLLKVLFGHDETNETHEFKFANSDDNWHDVIFERLGALLSVRASQEASLNNDSPRARQHLFFFAAIASLQAFVQANITGPPLPFNCANLLLPDSINKEQSAVTSLRQSLIKSLGLDGEAAYKLTPNVELLCLANTILTCPPIRKNVPAAEWAILRTNFMHQRILSEVSPTLQELVYDSLDALDDLLALNSSDSKFGDIHPSYLLEKTTIHIYFGLDKKARETLDEAAKRRNFEFVLTGRLGKRTKWQERDTSQLVVLAKSNTVSSPSEDGRRSHEASLENSVDAPSNTQPKALDLNDDTLLESISFTNQPSSAVSLVDEANLPKSLTGIDPENQPILHPLDSTMLLLLASSITNTSPADGLTREETLPYAVRVLNGGSSNWQVYTQALLVRSRIEGYRSRTTERGLLQLQALVDQVIAETTGNTQSLNSEPTANANTFLPRAQKSESAPATERLRYVFELCPPTRWELEAELAARWVSLGGLRTALEIYQRLEMRAEEALCWAAIDREDKARNIIRRQLFHSASGDDESSNIDEEKWQGSARDPPPNEAPRLYCILGDIDNDVSMYEKSWDVSNNRYARAQRSVGKYYFSRRKYLESAAAYSKALKVNQLNQSSWFAMGCCLLELDEFDRAAQAFGRTVQLDDTDAEAWSNLAAALLKRGADSTVSISTSDDSENADGQDDDYSLAASKAKDSQQHIRDALKALKRAASLKYENHKIWDNLLTVAASLKPPEYMDMVSAQRRIIELRGPVEGEKCIDVATLELIVRHVVSSNDAPIVQADSQATPNSRSIPTELRGLPRLVLSLFDDCVIPLITSSARLWRLVATLSLWRKQPGEALAANEKSWRVVTNPASGWENGTEEQWNEVVDATEELCDAYETLGLQPKENGSDGEIVAKDWPFKARSALRTVRGKGKPTWEDTQGWERLQQRLESLKAANAAT